VETNIKGNRKLDRGEEGMQRFVGTEGVTMCAAFYEANTGQESVTKTELGREGEERTSVYMIR